MYMARADLAFLSFRVRITTGNVTVECSLPVYLTHRVVSYHILLGCNAMRQLRPCIGIVSSEVLHYLFLMVGTLNQWRSFIPTS
jgi:hypothetical protein